MQISTHHAEAGWLEMGMGGDCKGKAGEGGGEVDGIIWGMRERGQVVTDKVAMLIF